MADIQPKKTYTPPELTRLGSVSQLTLSNFAGGKRDSSASPLGMTVS